MSRPTATTRASLGRRPAAPCRAVSKRSPPPPPPARASTPARIVRVVRAQSDLAWFENFAGRSAMLGFFSALYIEGATGSGIFPASAVPEQHPLLFFARSGACAACLLFVIYSRTLRKPEDVFVEDSFANFTSTKSPSSQIDDVVDRVIDDVAL